VKLPHVLPSPDDLFEIREVATGDLAGRIRGKVPRNERSEGETAAKIIGRQDFPGLSLVRIVVGIPFHQGVAAVAIGDGVHQEAAVADQVLVLAG
jgi:hypothetical protein